MVYVWYKLACSSAESYMHLYITESWYLLNCPLNIYAVIDICIPSTFNYEDYSIFTCCSKLTSTQMRPINGYMYGLKTLTKQSQSHFINMDIKIESMALVTVVNICQLVYAGCQRVCFCSKAITALLQKKKETFWHPGYNWCGPFIEIYLFTDLISTYQKIKTITCMYYM